jgi:DegV family protein with EDD domain
VNLDAGNTAIVLDSTADFPAAQKRFPNWRMVPLYVNFGADSFRDYVDLDPHEFYGRLRAASTLPTTSQPTPQDFLGAYEELGSYARVYSLHIAGSLSGTFQSASTAAAEADGGRVRTIDTGTVSAAIALLGFAIQRRLERGTTDEEIEQLIDRFRRDNRIIFTVDTLEYLARGGRIGRAKAWTGQLLNVKPILAIRDGEVVPLKRVRGNQKAVQEFVRALDTETRDEPSLRVGIAHADAPERAEQLRRMVEDRRPRATIDFEGPLGAVIGTHAGPGAVGFFWFDDR